MLKTNETGRSMVEMLGVLAIIGVLSVGGITGYTSAMRSYKANEIVNATSMLYAMAASQNVGKGDKDLSYTAVLGSLPSGCTGIDYSGSGKTISVKIEDQAVCNQVKNKFGTKVTAGDCITPNSGNYTLTVTLVELATVSDDDPSTAGWYWCDDGQVIYMGTNFNGDDPGLSRHNCPGACDHTAYPEYFFSRAEAKEALCE